VFRVIDEIKNLIIRPLKYPEVYKHVGVYPPRGVLIHGPPGSGKTKLALAIAGEANVPFFKVSAPELITSLSGVLRKNMLKFINNYQNLKHLKI
jgi:ribosome biogenesis ATPase